MNGCRCRWKQEMPRFRHSYATRPGKVTVLRLPGSNWSAGKKPWQLLNSCSGDSGTDRGKRGKGSQPRVTESLPAQMRPMKEGYKI